ncbi:MAG: rRNA (cytidine-2'-O-)-methyltransferase, partial [Candidatus Puniceispirillum sp. TMED52]
MLLVAATPIGNLDDHSPRLIEALRSADLIVAEDTRTTGQLMRLLGVDTRAVIMALHEHNELDVTEKVLSEAARGQVVLVSDAGMPGLSDPGFPIVRA